MSTVTTIILVAAGVIVGSLVFTILVVAYVFASDCLKCQAPDWHETALRMANLIPLLFFATRDLLRLRTKGEATSYRSFGDWLVARAFVIGFGLAVLPQISWLVPYLISSAGWIR